MSNIEKLRSSFPLFAQTFFGIDVIESKYAVRTVQDWSGCRSSARARRRHARGIKTRMVEKTEPTFYFMSPGKLIAHPDLVPALETTFGGGKPRDHE